MSRNLRLYALASRLLPEIGGTLASARVRLCRWAGRPSDPLPHSVVNGEKYYDEDEARAWVVSHIPPRVKAAPAEKNAIPSAPSSLSVVDGAEAVLLEVLRSGGSSPIERLRASAQLAARAVAKYYGTDRFSPRLFEDMKRQSEELRKAEEAYISLARERGDLVELDAARAAAGDIAARFVRALERLETSLAREVESWITDDVFRAMSPDDRRRRVIAFVASVAAEVRQSVAIELRGVENAKEKNQ